MREIETYMGSKYSRQNPLSLVFAQFQECFPGLEGVNQSACQFYRSLFLVDMIISLLSMKMCQRG